MTENYLKVWACSGQRRTLIYHREGERLVVGNLADWVKGVRRNVHTSRQEEVEQ